MEERLSISEMRVTVFQLCGQTNNMNAYSMDWKSDPAVLQMVDAVKEALLELQIFATSHPLEFASGESCEALIAAGALSPQTGAFLEKQQAQFCGFKPKPIRSDIPVFEVVLADRDTPLRIVGFRDGHVECVTVSA